MPSILSADFANLQTAIESVPSSDAIHVDVMDNHFVPNLTLGLPVVESIRKITDQMLDIHLMIDQPDRWAPAYAEAGAESVTFHVEAAGAARDREEGLVLVPQGPGGVGAHEVARRRVQRTPVGEAHLGQGKLHTGLPGPEARGVGHRPPEFGVQLARFGAREYVGNVVSLSLVRELGPVMTALMVGGRVGAGIAAELGSMAVTEQLDAIRSMGADPAKKLVFPRVLATVLVLPMLTTFADILGVMGAMVVAKIEYGINHVYFVNALTRLPATRGSPFESLMFTSAAGPWHTAATTPPRS